MKAARQGPSSGLGQEVQIYAVDSRRGLGWLFQLVWLEAEVAHQGHSPMPGSPRRAGYAQELTHCGGWHQRQGPSVASLLCN